MKTLKKRHIVIIGGGFGGLYTAMNLLKANVQITLIDKRNFHLFQPLLYQVASGGLSPADIAFPLRAIFKKQKNIRIVLGEVNDLDLEQKNITLGRDTISYDDLIIAAGSSNHYFGNEQWSEIAPGLKTVEDATSIRGKILSAFEKAENENDPAEKRALLTFAIIGGGPAGVEMAGAIAELSRHTLRCDFENINPSQAQILLIEGTARVLQMYPDQLSQKAGKTLQNLGVEIIAGSYVTDISNDELTLVSGDSSQVVRAKTIIWTAGVKANPLGRILNKKYNIELDNAGRVIVNSNCRVPEYPNVFIIGDMANFQKDDGSLLPGVASTAMQQGRYVAGIIKDDLDGKESRAFQYRDKGSMAVIGRKAAVAFRGKFKYSGMVAWLIWILVHLLYLVGFESRILVAIQWGFNYFTFNRSARLITNNAKS